MFSEYHNEDRYSLLSQTVEGSLRRGFGRFSGVSLLLGIAACWISLLSWSVTDPSLTHATREAAQNLLGYPGAVVSDLMLQTFGMISSLLLMAPMFWGLELALGGSVKGPRWKVLSYAVSLLLVAGAFSIVPKFLAWPLNHGYGGIVGDGIAAVAVWAAGKAVPDFANALGFVTLLAAGLFFAFAATGVSVARMREAISQILSGAKQPERRRSQRSAPAGRTGPQRQEPWFPPMHGAAPKMQVTPDPQKHDDRLSGEHTGSRWSQGPLSERHWREPELYEVSGLRSDAASVRVDSDAEQAAQNDADRRAETGFQSREAASVSNKSPDFVAAFDEDDDGFGEREVEFDSITDRDCRLIAERFRPEFRSGHRTVMQEILRNAAKRIGGRGVQAEVPAPESASSWVEDSGIVPRADDTGHMEPTVELEAPVERPRNETQETPSAGARQEEDELHFDAQTEPANQNDPEPDEPKREQTPKGTVRKSGGYCRPSLNLLKSSTPARPSPELTEVVLRGTSRLLEDVLERFGVKGTISEVRPGPVVTVYEVQLAKGSNPMRVVGLADDIGRAMSAGSVRVAAVPLAGGAGVVIEMANVHRHRASLRDLLSGEAYRSFGGQMPVALGHSTGGQPIVADLGVLGNVLIAGREGSGKSSLLRSMVLSLVYRSSPDDCRLMLFDPKLLEFGQFNGAPHLICPVLSEPEKMIAALEWVMVEIDERAQRIARLQARSLEIFNNRVRNARKRGEMIARSVPTGWCERTGKQVFEHEQIEFEPMPHIFVAIDELSDLMGAAPRQCEQALIKIAEMGRGVGIHLAAGTKTTSGLCLTEKIRSAVGTSVAFKLGSKVDSRLVVGEPGAEQLLAQGDAILSVGDGRRMRLHTPFVSQEEVEAVAAALKATGPSMYAPSLMVRLQDAVEPYPEQMAASPGGQR